MIFASFKVNTLKMIDLVKLRKRLYYLVINK